MTYRVKAGDTLSGIARRYGLTLAQLLAMNPHITDPNRIYPGQCLTLSVGLAWQDLRAIVPRLTVDRAYLLMEPINVAMAEAEITTPLRIAAFIAQTAHETGGYRWFRELGSDYYFERYEGRTDLGNVHPGDGARYKGRGFIMITGRDNYRRAGKDLNLPLEQHPELAEAPEAAARIAGWYWHKWRINRAADRDDLQAVTRLVNGGLNGLADRERYYVRAKGVLGIA